MSIEPFALLGNKLVRLNKGIDTIVKSYRSDRKKGRSFVLQLNLIFIKLIFINITYFRIAIGQCCRCLCCFNCKSKTVFLFFYSKYRNENNKGIFLGWFGKRRFWNIQDNYVWKLSWIHQKNLCILFIESWIEISLYIFCKIIHSHHFAGDLILWVCLTW